MEAHIARVPEDLRQLLLEVIAARRPDLLSILVTEPPGELDDALRSELRIALGEELCETGLRVDDEPNERGLLLESLIDVLGHL